MISLANGLKNVFYFEGGRDINSLHYAATLLAGLRRGLHGADFSGEFVQRSITFLFS